MKMYYAIDPNKLSEEIRAQDLKKWWLAEQVGVHRSTLRRWLIGEISHVHYRHWEKLCEQLACGESKLLIS